MPLTDICRPARFVVAIDGPRGNIYVAEWDPTLVIFVFDLATVTYQRSIPLRPPGKCR